MADHQYSNSESSNYFGSLNTGRGRSDSARSRGTGNGTRPLVENSDFSSRPTIRIRRAPSAITSTTTTTATTSSGPTTTTTTSTFVPQYNYQQNNGQSSNGRIQIQDNGQHVGRSRSASAPLRLNTNSNTVGSSRQGNNIMPELTEETFSPTTGNVQEGSRPLSIGRDFAEHGGPSIPLQDMEKPDSRWKTLRRARTNIGTDANSAQRDGQQNNGRRQDEYDSELVDLLDLVDPEIATLNTLNNVQNSLFIPNLGKYLNRRPTYDLSRPESEEESSGEDGADSSTVDSTTMQRPHASRLDTGATLNTLTSRVNEKYFAVLPHGVALRGWTEEEKLELNDHVRHMLHSKRSKLKRGMKGFGKYFRTPLGAFVTIYATLITTFGLVWVLFLIGWISLGSRKDYIVNIVDYILVALFAIMGDGLAPFRAVDTYHMCFIAHYHHLTWRLRKEQALPKLHNKNDLPAVQPNDLEAQTKDDMEDSAEFSVLSPEQVKKLAHHQKKFSKSHSFYKPHETATHHAFPLRMLVAIVVLLDCHSCLQIALGACTWGISYHVRPFALTTVILCCSITVNITAGVLISIGDHKTRKKDVMERMYKQELTAEAMKKMNKKAKKSLLETGEFDEEDLESEQFKGPLRSMTPMTQLEEEGQFGIDGKMREEKEKKRREELERTAATPYKTPSESPGPTPPPK